MTSCPRERFPTIEAAEHAVLQRRARANLSGGQRHDHAYYCTGCAGAHISSCPNPVHSHPLPIGYAAHAGAADDRLADGWRNHACPDCGHYGWTPPGQAA